MSTDDERVRHARDSSGDPPIAGLARDLSDLARQLQAEESMGSLLETIVAAAVREIPGVEHAGITSVNGGTVRTEAATDAIMARLDEAQHVAGDGPCLTSLREQVTVRSDDLTTEERWPRFGPAAVREGARSVLAVQLFVEGDNLGALNLYATSPDAFTDEDETTAMLLAAHAAIAMKGSREQASLRVALSSRDVIGQAKGILMERYRIDELTAFRLLDKASQDTNRKLRDIAEELATTGDFAPRTRRPRR